MAKGRRNSGFSTSKYVESGETILGRLGKQMAGERKGDYRTALNTQNAISANLARQTSRLTRQIQGQSLRQAAAVTRLSARGKAVQRGVTAAQNRAEGYAGMGQVAEQQFGVARATGAAAKAITAAQAREAMSGVGTAKLVSRIAAQAVAGLGEAAQYGLAQALQQRTIIDNNTLAQLTGQMYNTALQYNMQWEMWKKQQEYAADQAKKANKQGVGRLAAETPLIMDSINGVVGELRDNGELNGATAPEVAAKVMGELGYDPTANPAESQYIMAIARNYVSMAHSGGGGGGGIAAATNAAITQIYGDSQGFERWGQPLQDSINSYSNIYDPSDDRPMETGAGPAASAQDGGTGTSTNGLPLSPSGEAPPSGAVKGTWKKETYNYQGYSGERWVWQDAPTNPKLKPAPDGTEVPSGAQAGKWVKKTEDVVLGGGYTTKSTYYVWEEE